MLAAAGPLAVAERPVAERPVAAEQLAVEHEQSAVVAERLAVGHEQPAVVAAAEQLQLLEHLEPAVEKWLVLVETGEAVHLENYSALLKLPAASPSVVPSFAVAELAEQLLLVAVVDLLLIVLEDAVVMGLVPALLQIGLG